MEINEKSKLKECYFYYLEQVIDQITYCAVVNGKGRYYLLKALQANIYM